MYKYRHFEDENHLQTIRKGTFWFAHADSFNDPFDLNWGFNYGGARAKKLEWARDFLRREKPQLSEEERQQFAERRIEELENNPEELRKIAGWHIQQNKDKFGICSLSAKEDDILMWSHYAADHTGFCVGLDTEELLRIQKRQARLHEVLLDLHRIEYQDKIPDINFFDAMMSHPKKSIVPFVATKSSHWDYEEEYRLLLYDHPNTAYPLGIRVVEEIILGCEVDKENREEVLSIVENRPKAGISVYQAEKHEQRYELKFRELRGGE